MGAYETLLLDAITGQESGGNYGAVGQPVLDSNGKTVTALGRYQFLPGTAASNVPSWFTQQYGTDYYSTQWQQAFLGSPAAQDAAADNLLTSLESTASKTDPSFSKQSETFYVAEGWYGGSGSIGGPDIPGQGSGAPSLYGYANSVQQRFNALLKNPINANSLAASAGVGVNTDLSGQLNTVTKTAQSNAGPAVTGIKNAASQAATDPNAQPGDTFLMGANISEFARGIEKNVLIGGIILAVLAGGFAILASSYKGPVPVPV